MFWPEVLPASDKLVKLQPKLTNLYYLSLCLPGPARQERTITPCEVLTSCQYRR